MKIKGESFDSPKPIDVALNFGDQVVVLRVKAVLDYSPFEKLVPMPTPPEIIRPGGERSVDVKDKKYREAVSTYARRKTLFMMLESLSATEDLEWDTVDRSKPDTWDRLEKEISKSFTEYGLAKILQAVLQVNGLGESMVEEARSSFLASQSRQSEK